MAGVVDISPEFSAALSELMQYAGQAARGMAGIASSSDVRGRFYIPRPDRWNGDTTNSVEATKAFNRQSLETGFQTAVTSPEGTRGDLMLAQIQGDFLSLMERAYHTRHASAVRCRAHASGRLLGHSSPVGSIQLGIGDFVKDLSKRSRS